MGDISPHPKTGRRVQDVKVVGILADKQKQAIRMVGAKQKRILSDTQKAVLNLRLSTFRFGAEQNRAPAG